MLRKTAAKLELLLLFALVSCSQLALTGCQQAPGAPPNAMSSQFQSLLAAAASGGCPNGNCPGAAGLSNPFGSDFASALGSCPNGNCPNGRCPSGNCPNGNCPGSRGSALGLAGGNCPNGNCPTGNCPNGNCPNPGSLASARGLEQGPGTCPGGGCPNGTCPNGGSCPGGNCPNAYSAYSLGAVPGLGGTPCSCPGGTCAGQGCQNCDSGGCSCNSGINSQSGSFGDYST